MQTLKKIWFLLQGSQLPYGETDQKQMNNGIEMIFEYSGVSGIDLARLRGELGQLGMHTAWQEERARGLRGPVSRVSCHQAAIAVVSRCA